MKLSAIDRLRPSALFRRLIYQQTGGVVRSGPFEGMRYPDRSLWGAYLPKLTGTYELELHPWIELVIDSDFDLMVDLGAAEGFYAVGLLMRKPTSTMVAFEMLEDGRDLLSETAKKNGVSERLTVYGFADPGELEAVLADAERPFVMCDIEGHELDLLRLAQVPSLARAHMLVEVHDDISPGISDILREEFAGSHRSCLIPSRPRSIEDLPGAGGLERGMSILYKRYVLNEFRGRANKWMWLEPNP